MVPHHFVKRLHQQVRSIQDSMLATVPDIAALKTCRGSKLSRALERVERTQLDALTQALKEIELHLAVSLFDGGIYQAKDLAPIPPHFHEMAAGSGA
jgi:hypothetical protein